MNLSEKLSSAFAAFNTRNFDVALSLVDELKKSSSHAKKIFMLEAWIYFEQDQYLRAFNVLEKLLPRFDLADSYEKFLSAQTSNRLGQICDALSLTVEAVKFYRLAANLHDEKAKACAAMSNAIYIANALENFSREDFQKLYAEYKSYLSDIVPFAPKFHTHKKIRVGFVSADFHWHPTMNWSFALLTRLDKNFFATYFYSVNSVVDNLTRQIQFTADVWRNISALTDLQAAQLIRDDEIDILVDLSGHTSGNRLRVAAYRPASVQISGIGYINSTGLDCFDYFLSDEICAGDETYFTEKLIRLPHTHFCYTPNVEPEICAPPPHLQNGFVTFGCFNNFAKVTDTILAAWKKILDRVSESRLLLKHKIFDTPDGQKFVAERLESFGFNLKRVDMRGYTTNYLDDYSDIDVALDTFPYTGGVTTCEALWLGVPVVSLYGSRHGTRFGLSMLANVGLPELAAATVDEYISRAVMLAGDWELLTLLRRNLRNMMKNSPLMDATAYVREVEKIFVRILLAALKKFCAVAIIARR